MAQVKYPECIRELYESEILGEALCLALLEVATNDRERYVHGTLLQLESETQARLRPFLYKYGISLSKDVHLGLVAELVASYRKGTWQDYCNGSIPVAKQFLSRFEEIAAAGQKKIRKFCDRWLGMKPQYCDGWRWKRLGKPMVRWTQ